MSNKNNEFTYTAMDTEDGPMILLSDILCYLNNRKRLCQKNDWTGQYVIDKILEDMESLRETIDEEKGA